MHSNGVSEPGEVRPLAEHGIVALSVGYRHDPDHPDRIAFVPDGARFRDGSVRPTFDVILKQR